MKYLSNDECFNRLKREFDKHLKLVIGFDFDNTIFDVHNEGFECSLLITLLKKAKELGFIMCLYTSESSPERLEWKKEFCRFYGFEPDYVNSSPLLGGSTVKPFLIYYSTIELGFIQHLHF